MRSSGLFYPRFLSTLFVQCCKIVLRCLTSASKGKCDEAKPSPPFHLLLSGRVFSADDCRSHSVCFRMFHPTFGRASMLL